MMSVDTALKLIALSRERERRERELDRPKD